MDLDCTAEAQHMGQLQLVGGPDLVENGNGRPAEQTKKIKFGNRATT